MFRRVILAFAGIFAMPAICLAAVGDPLPALGPQTYDLEFSTKATAPQFAAAYPGLATWGYFGDEPLLLKTPPPKLTQAQRFTSRSWPGIEDAYVDPGYCPGAITPKVTSGLEIDAYRWFTAADAASCGQGKRSWASAIVTSQPNPYGPSGKWAFAQAYGYFEVKAHLPCDPGRWPAFWLLGVDTGVKTEVDVFEHYGGPITVQSQGRPYVINRVGQPFSTVHSATGANGAMVAASNAQALPAMTTAQRQVFCSASHLFGMLWTPETFTFYVDRRETFETANPGISDPHYWLLNLDISATAGDPTQDANPSAYLAYSVKAWATK